MRNNDDPVLFDGKYGRLVIKEYPPNLDEAAIPEIKHCTTILVDGKPDYSLIWQPKDDGCASET